MPVCNRYSFMRVSRKESVSQSTKGTMHWKQTLCVRSVKMMKFADACYKAGVFRTSLFRGFYSSGKVLFLLLSRIFLHKLSQINYIDGG